jgi:hypothetical protein
MQSVILNFRTSEQRQYLVPFLYARCICTKPRESVPTIDTLFIDESRFINLVRQREVYPYINLNLLKLTGYVMHQQV